MLEPPSRSDAGHYGRIAWIPERGFMMGNTGNTRGRNPLVTLFAALFGIVRAFSSAKGTLLSSGSRYEDDDAFLRSSSILGNGFPYPDPRENPRFGEEYDWGQSATSPHSSGGTTDTGSASSDGNSSSV